ncbi:MAG: GrpB family protein [Roseateles asaccharophilus]|uniref:GrpB family protein n=1 Tax=Roseateles asaccharophilus TaxID=582607 RepID=UPI003918D0FE
MSASVEIVRYSPDWPAKFEAEKQALLSVLSPWLVGEIQHVGSTAVAGLSAKPIIDIMAPVSSLLESEAAIASAVAAGYSYYPYRADVMHWFCKPSPDVRTHHLHLVPYGSELWLDRLAFRDALRKNQALADEYASLKLRLARQFPDDREAYTQGKTPFVHRVLSNVRPEKSNAT